MPAAITLLNCALQMRRKVGVNPDTGKDKLNSLTFTGISNEASAATLLGVSNAIQSVITDPIINVYRNDKSLVDAGE